MDQVEAPSGAVRILDLLFGIVLRAIYSAILATDELTVLQLFVQAEARSLFEFL